MGARVLGIDFSGSADQWRPGRRRSNVWIASGEGAGAELRLDDLRPVQALDGEGAPFERLVRLLAHTDAVAAIDAPFSIPRSHAASAALLWVEVGELSREGRPFGRGGDFVAGVAPKAGPHGLKLYRACESAWRRKGLNVRSTLWCGPRGGAAFGVACMTLLRRHAGPIWPFRPDGEGALVVEAYPAAQLLTWGLRPVGYNGPTPKAKAARLAIIESLTRDHGLVASGEHLGVCEENADALDAVICAYAAKAMAEGRHPRRLPAVARSEGWAVVDDPAQAVETPPSLAPGNETGPLVSLAVERRLRRLFASVQVAFDDSAASPDAATS
jgi:predicted nuclease with RNAse H fold